MPTNYTGVYDNLLQGISQQPVRDRSPGQCTDQLNLIPDPIEGLKDRPPLEYINKFFDSIPSDAKWYNYKRGNEEYIMAVHNGSVDVTTYTGAPLSVTVDPRSAAYLERGSLSYKDKLNMVTAGDITLISNSEVDTTILQPSQFAEWADSLIYFRSVVPGRKMSLRFTDEDGTSVGPFTYTVPTSISSVDISFDSSTGEADDTARQSDIDSRIKQQGNDVVAKDMYDVIVANTDFTNKFEAFINGSVIHIQHKETNAEGYRKKVTSSVTDDLGGTSIYPINREVNQASDLPPYAPNGYVVRVSLGASSEDDYYLKFRSDLGTGFSNYSGIWEETAHPQQNFRINSEDMPQALIRQPDGSFKLTPLDQEEEDANFGIAWRDRRAGDDETNPMPKFLGNPITDMGLFQERLYLISGEYITFSESLDYWDFFKKSAKTELVTDPINKPANNNEVAVLKYAVQHNRDLIVFAENVQFRISGRNPITQNSISMVVTTQYATDLKVRPAAAGGVIFFPFRTGAYSGIREFYTHNEAETNDARPVSAQVDKLIKGSITLMDASSQEDLLLIQSEGNPREVFLYKYLWQGGERVQAAWGRWEFCNTQDLVHMFFDQSDLYMMFRQADGSVSGCYISLEDSELPGVGVNVYLDYRVFGSIIGQTIELPADYPLPEDLDKLTAVMGAGTKNPGIEIPITDIDETTKVITLAKSVDGDMYVGRSFTRSYKPSMPVRRDRDGRYIEPYRFIVSSFEVSFENTGPFDVVVKHPSYGEFNYRNSNRIVGIARVGEDNLLTATFEVGVRMPVKQLEIEYKTDSHSPFKLSALTWFGQITMKGRRA